jgi:hypothetical protein
MARVLVVPGLAVRAYAEPPVQHLRDNGHNATLLKPPAWRGVDHDLERYGRHLAADIDSDGVLRWMCSSVCRPAPRPPLLVRH